MSESTSNLDPVTLTVIQNGLIQVCNEMDLAFVRAAFSPVISEGMDRSDGIYDAIDGSLIAQGSPRVLREQLRERLVGVEVKRTVEAMRALRELPEIADVTIHGYELRVLFHAPIDLDAHGARLAQAAAGAGAPIERMYPLDPTLEDLFIGYARQNVTPDTPRS